jgi:uncharacterized protein (DUF1800 family)
MPVSNQVRNQHLLWRAGFGPSAESIQELANASQGEIFKRLLKFSSKNPEYIDVANNAFDGLFKGLQEAGRIENLSKEQKQALRKQSREGIRNLNLRWIEEMVNGQAQLLEKMAFFWHGHFACRNLNMYFQQGLLDIIRKNALGNFGELLREVSKSAAMLAFLNNQQNRKQHPNENFAREVMELFTMGRGNYTEEDIREAARAFTGWGFTIGGEFVFRKQLHDNGVKTVLGRRGNFDGDDILDILLEHRQTARFIAGKIYKYFVNEELDEANLSWVSDRFYNSNYDIRKLMEDIFTSDWFYDPRNIGTRIKSPVELLVGMRRILPMELANEEMQLMFQKVLGQILFYPPNVAGWPGGKNWIDGSSLMVRLRIPGLIAENDEFNLKPKTDDDQQMGQMMREPDDPGPSMTRAPNTAGLRIEARVEWDVYLQNFSGVEKKDLIRSIAGILFQKTEVNDKTIMKYADINNRESFIRTATIKMMSMPEYQLC